MNHSSPAQDLALDTAIKSDARLIVINKSYLLHSRMPSTPGWQRVNTSTTAILIEDGLKFTQVDVSSGNTIAVEVGGVLLVGTYLSPNIDPRNKFLILHNLLLQEHRIILLGDFNCQHTDLTNRGLRERDRSFLQLIYDHCLEMANDGCPTLDHQGNLSTNDYTLYKRVSVLWWNVLTDTESLTDHRYVVFETGIQLPARRSLLKIDAARLKKLLESRPPPLDMDLRSRRECCCYAGKLTDYLSNLVHICTTEVVIKSRSHW